MHTQFDATMPAGRPEFAQELARALAPHNYTDGDGFCVVYWHDDEENASVFTGDTEMHARKHDLVFYCHTIADANVKLHHEFG